MYTFVSLFDYLLTGRRGGEGGEPATFRPSLDEWQTGLRHPALLIAHGTVFTNTDPRCTRRPPCGHASSLLSQVCALLFYCMYFFKNRYPSPTYKQKIGEIGPQRHNKLERYEV